MELMKYFDMKILIEFPMGELDAVLHSLCMERHLGNDPHNTRQEHVVEISFLCVAAPVVAAFGDELHEWSHMGLMMQTPLPEERSQREVKEEMERPPESRAVDAGTNVPLQ